MTKAEHWDGVGHRILDYFGMRKLFRGDERSMNILSSVPPHRYKLVPGLELTLHGVEKWVEVKRIYPTDVTRSTYFLSERQLVSMRKFYKRCVNEGWDMRVMPHGIVFKRPMRLEIKDKAREWGE